jgi:hypothetical protein
MDYLKTQIRPPMRSNTIMNLVASCASVLHVCQSFRGAIMTSTCERVVVALLGNYVSATISSHLALCLKRFSFQNVIS